MHLESRRLLHHIGFGYHLMGGATQITVSAKRSCNGKTVCSAILPYHLLRHFLSPGLNLPRYTAFSKMWSLSASPAWHQRIPHSNITDIVIQHLFLRNQFQSLHRSQLLFCQKKNILHKYHVQNCKLLSAVLLDQQSNTL